MRALFQCFYHRGLQVIVSINNIKGVDNYSLYHHQAFQFAYYWTVLIHPATDPSGFMCKLFLQVFYSLYYIYNFCFLYNLFVPLSDLLCYANHTVFHGSWLVVLNLLTIVFNVLHMLSAALKYCSIFQSLSIELNLSSPSLFNFYPLVPFSQEIP